MNSRDKLRSENITELNHEKMVGLSIKEINKSADVLPFRDNFVLKIHTVKRGITFCAYRLKKNVVDRRTVT